MNEVDPKSSASRWPARIAAVVTAVVAGTGVGVAAGAIQQAGFAPVGIVSLAVGGMLGVVLIGASAVFNLPKPWWGSAVLAAALAVVSQHLWLYSVAMAAREKATRSQPAVELFKPGWTQESFWSYLQTEATFPTVTLWLVDALLLGLAAVIIVNWSGNKSERDAPGERGA